MIPTAIVQYLDPTLKHLLYILYEHYADGTSILYVFSRGIGRYRSQNRPI